jgi:hypothetical protein
LLIYVAGPPSYTQDKSSDCVHQIHDTGQRPIKLPSSSEDSGLGGSSSTDDGDGFLSKHDGFTSKCCHECFDHAIQLLIQPIRVFVHTNFERQFPTINFDYRLRQYQDENRVDRNC